MKNKTIQLFLKRKMAHFYKNKKCILPSSAVETAGLTSGFARHECL
jgi:hypothetical protein